MKNHFGIMIDCSRNAVYTVDALKRLIGYLAEMGYNSLLLYTEDTYEIKDEPYFGYLRGRYTTEEIRQIDAYCLEKGMELIPCIQTLAHLNAIFRWDRYEEVHDLADILLIDDEKTYELIEKMIASLAEKFTSRNIHIGMDEAHLVGLGKYFRQHGTCDKFELLQRHLKRVEQICNKYGFQPMMWSDMFFRIISGGYYVHEPEDITPEHGKNIPDTVSLVYWDYYSTEKKHYDIMMKAHKNFGKPVWFAGGFWTWVGFAPKNGYSLRASKQAMEACKENGIENIFFTMWGDDGAECSVFSVLPTMFSVSQLQKGITDETVIRQNFKKMFGMDYEDFMLLDLPGINGDEHVTNPEKYMLYNDYFLGIYDTIADETLGETYAQLAKKLANCTVKREFAHLFRFEQTLCEVLALKNDIGIKTRRYYQSGDKEQLQTLLPVYDAIAEKVEELLQNQTTMWFAEKKPFGFEVQEARMGALLTRTKSCRNRLKQYLDGTVPEIPELKEKLLMPSVYDRPGQSRKIQMNSWNASFINRSGF